MGEQQSTYHKAISGGDENLEICHGDHEAVWLQRHTTNVQRSHQEVGLEKNIKEHEAMAILHAKCQRDIVGKKTVVQKHGQSVNIQRFLNHVNRKQKQASSQEAPVLMSSYIFCRTPSPAPVPALSNDEIQIDPLGFGTSEALARYGLYTAIEDSDDHIERHVLQLATGPFIDEEALRVTIYEISKLCRSQTHSPSVSYSLHMPQTLRVPEDLLQNLKALYAGSFESGAWMVDNYGFCYVNPTQEIHKPKALQHFQDLCISAVTLKWSNSNLELRRVLSKAFDALQDVLRSCQPRTINTLFEVLLDLRRITCQIFMSGWGRIYELLSTLEQLSFDEAISTGWQCINDALEARVGYFGSSSLISRLNFITIGYGSQDLVECERRLRELLQSEQTSNATSQNAKIGNALATNMYNQGKFAEAEELGLQILSLARDPESCITPETQVHTLDIIASSQYSLWKGSEAEQHFREAIQLSVDQWGFTSPWVVDQMVTLERWLRGWDRIEEADVLRLEIRELIGLDMTDLEEMGLA